MQLEGQWRPLLSKIGNTRGGPSMSQRSWVSLGRVLFEERSSCVEVLATYELLRDV